MRWQTSAAPRSGTSSAVKSIHRDARRKAMYGACRLCQHDQSLTKLAVIFGVSMAGLTRARDRAAADGRQKVCVAILTQVRCPLSIAQATLIWVTLMPPHALNAFSS